MGFTLNYPSIAVAFKENGGAAEDGHQRRRAELDVHGTCRCAGDGSEGEDRAHDAGIRGVRREEELPGVGGCVGGGEGEGGQRGWAGEAAHGEEPHCRDVACRMKSWSGSAASWCLILQSLSVSIIATTNGEKTM